MSKSWYEQMSDQERRELYAKHQLWAKQLYLRWLSSHGAGSESAWDKLDEWERGYWQAVSEFVFENFDEKEP